MESKWQTLLEQLDVIINPGLSPCKELEINNFEKKFGFVLPSEYKSFCQIFGSVSFGNEVYVHCPNIDIVLEKQRNFFRSVLNPQKEDFEIWEDYQQQSYKRICDLIEYAYFFGSTAVGLYFCFDLRTYSLDERYDIYVISLVRDFGVEHLGRDFFVFIRDYCLGTKFYDSLPTEMQLFDPYELVIDSA